jgi:hypothetical protein
MLTTEAAAAAASSLGNNTCVHPVTTDCFLLLTSAQEAGSPRNRDMMMILPPLSTSIGILLSEDLNESD